MTRRLLLLTLITLISCAAARVQLVAIHVLGDVGPAPADVQLVITVQPNHENRGLWVAIESSGYATAHFEELDVHSPIQRTVTFKQLPGGEYTAWARLLRVHGETSASDTFIIDGAYPDADCHDYNASGDCLDPQAP